MVRTTLVIAAACVTLLSAEVAHAQRFTDNNDGTVTDHQTGLMWEKKTPPGSGTPGRGRIHDVNEKFTWCNGELAGDPGYPCKWHLLGNLADGTIFTLFLGILNHGDGGDNDKGCFANHCDWRIPSSRELETIYDRRYCGGACIDPVFGPTQADFYVSITTDASADSSVYVKGVDFAGRNSGNYRQKIYSSYVRAVRTLVR